MHSKNTLLRRLPRPLADILVEGRNVLLRLLSPFDRLWLIVNGKGAWPPIWLRRYAGPLRTFDSAAAEFSLLLKIAANLRSNHAILDLGCGCGALALQLADYLRPERGGRYVGIDIHAPSIRWCQRHLQRPGFSFVRLDAHNSAYNPGGKMDFDYRAALARLGKFNTVVAKSLFTHLRPEACSAYLQAVKDVLEPDGLFVFSIFAFESQDQLDNAAIAFKFGDAHFRYAYAHRIESAVAFSRAWLDRALSEAGLTIKAHYPGAWRAAEEGLSFQDIFVVAPRAAH